MKKILSNTKNWLTELNKKALWYEKLAISIIMVVAVFFSIATIDKTNGLQLAAGFKGQSWLTFDFKTGMKSLSAIPALGYIGQFMILTGTIFAMFTMINRIHRFKQEMSLAIISNVLIGGGLLLTGIMTDGILIAVFQLSISLAAWPIWNQKGVKGNQVEVESKFGFKEVLITTVMFVSSYALIVLVYANLGNGGYGYAQGFMKNIKSWQLYVDALAASSAATGIIMITVFKWSKGFLVLFVSNIIGMVVYSGVGTEHSLFWNIPLFILMFFYTAAVSYTYIKWEKIKK